MTRPLTSAQVNDVLTPIDRETKLFHDDLVGLGGPTHVVSGKQGFF